MRAFANRNGRTGTEDTLRLLVCDDHPIVRDGIKSWLENQPDFEVVGEARHGAEAVTLARRLLPDVILMDLAMPEMCGVEAIRRIKAERPETKILVLTTYETDADVMRALEEGALGYVLKGSSKEKLFGAIRQVSQNKSPLSEGAASMLVGRLGSGGQAKLSAREIEVLRLVADGANNKRVQKELHLSEGTVKSHMTHILAKLGAADRAGAVIEALHQGIIRLDR